MTEHALTHIVVYLTNMYGAHPMGQVVGWSLEEGLGILSGLMTFELTFKD